MDSAFVSADRFLVPFLIQTPRLISTILRVTFDRSRFLLSFTPRTPPEISLQDLMENVADWSSRDFVLFLRTHDNELNARIRKIRHATRAIQQTQQSFEAAIRIAFDHTVIKLRQLQLDLDVAKAQQSELQAWYNEASIRVGRTEEENHDLEEKLRSSTSENEELKNELGVAKREATRKDKKLKKLTERLIEVLEERHGQMNQPIDGSVEIQMPELEELRDELAVMNLQEGHAIM